MADRLTPKQEKFAQLVATGKAATLTEAYETAYDAENSSRATKYARASELAADSKVAARIDSLRHLSSTRTVEEHIGALTGLRNIAVEEGQLSAAVKAEEMAGRASSLYIDRSINEHVHRLADTDVHQPVIDAVETNAELSELILVALLNRPEMRERAKELLGGGVVCLSRARSPELTQAEAHSTSNSTAPHND